MRINPIRSARVRPTCSSRRCLDLPPDALCICGPCASYALADAEAVVAARAADDAWKQRDTRPGWYAECDAAEGAAWRRRRRAERRAYAVRAAAIRAAADAGAR